MSNKANAVLNPAGIFIDGPRLFTTKNFEARNFPVSYGLNWYVDGRVASSGNGKTWKRAFQTITEALTAVAAAYSTDSDNVFQTIYVAPGDYDEGAALALSVEGTRIIGSGDEYRNISMLYSSSGTYNLIEIDAHQCEIIGMGLSVIPDTKSAIVISGTSTSYKCRVAHCRLDGWSGEYGVYLNESPDTIIENNLFRSFNTAAIYANSTRTNIINNIFHVVSAKVGIQYVPTGGNRPDGVIMNNVFSGVTNTTTTGIKLDGTPSNGTCIITLNRFHGSFDTSITQTTSMLATENYNSNNAGGAIVDATS